MKRRCLISLLVISIIIGLCGCSSKKEIHNYGETISSDTVELTVNSAELTYYASSVNNNTCAKPVDYSDGIYVAPNGSCLISMEFKIKNIGRSHLNVADIYGDFPLCWGIEYKGKVYNIKGFDLNNFYGYSLNLAWGCCLENGKTTSYHGSSNRIIDAGEELTFRVVGIICDFEPESLEDDFYFMVNIPSSGKMTDYYYYQ